MCLSTHLLKHGNVLCVRNLPPSVTILVKEDGCQESAHTKSICRSKKQILESRARKYTLPSAAPGPTWLPSMFTGQRSSAVVRKGPASIPRPTSPSGFSQYRAGSKSISPFSSAGPHSQRLLLAKRCGGPAPSLPGVLRDHRQAL